MNNKQNRYAYIDFIRVFSICSVITLHCIYEYYNDSANKGQYFWVILGYVNELSRTGVPLFFMISGFLLLKNDIPDIKAFYKRRFSKILIPFIIYDVFYYIIFGLLNKKDISAGGFITELLNCGSAYHLWFIYSIMFLYLAIPIIKIITDKLSFNGMLALFILIIFQTTIKPFINTLADGRIYVYLAEDGMCGYLGYMLLGYILGHGRIPPKAEKALYTIGIASFVVFPTISMYSAKSGSGLLFNGGYFINHYLEAAALFVFCKNNAPKSIKSITATASVTMDVYFIHIAVLEATKKLICNMPPVQMIGIWIITVILFSFLYGFTKKEITKFLKGVYKYVKEINNTDSADTF